MSLAQRLVENGLIRPPKWLPANVHYETITGSMAYGVSGDSSDWDVVGFCIPSKELIWPHLAGEIPGFGRQLKRFEQYQEHHVLDPHEAAGQGRTYDLTLYSIVKFFQLCMENNPNMVDSLFTPQNCVLTCTRIGQRVREQRRIFLHKGCWHKFKGYAYSQLHAMASKKPEGKRLELVEQHGFDVKYAYHTVRLLLEVEQILEEGDLDLQRHREQLKAIRRGDWTQEQIREYFTRREKDLEELYHRSPLPHSPDEGRIRQLLLECLEEHYGTLEGCLVAPDRARTALREIRAILDRVPDL